VALLVAAIATPATRAEGGPSLGAALPSANDTPPTGLVYHLSDAVHFEIPRAALAHREAICRETDLIAIARVLGAVSRVTAKTWSPVETELDLRLDSVIFGPPLDRAVLTLPGGSAGRRSFRPIAFPAVERGDLLLLFLRALPSGRHAPVAGGLGVIQLDPRLPELDWRALRAIWRDHCFSQQASETAPHAPAEQP
jgi:hypothetical protein